MPTIFLVEDDDMTTPVKPSNSAKLYSHPHVEDYIEIISGYRLPNGKNNHSIFTLAEPVVSLARYDMKVVPSLAEQSIGGKGYTDRQAKLATDLVIKYERQLFKLGIDITPVRTPQFRIPIRELDRSTRVWVENDLIKLKFPYNEKLIDSVRAASKLSNGAFKFNSAVKHHEADLTEWNLNWIYSFAKEHGFEIDQSVTDLMDLVLKVEASGYKIELTINNDQLSITNAPDSLVEYIESNLGGFGLENIITLSDYAPILGYTVDPAISNEVIKNFSNRFWSLCANRQLKVESLLSNDLVKEVAEYASATNRFPIFIYEPDLSSRLLNDFNKYFPGNIVNLDNKLMNNVIDDTTKIVYTTKIPKKQFDRIPLLVSSAGMLFGGDRQMWIQSAEKVVYFSKEVYNKNVKGQTVCKLN